MDLTCEKQNVPRISRSIPNAMVDEQIAAGWPAWLVAAGTEAIHGWLPRKLESSVCGFDPNRS